MVSDERFVPDDVPEVVVEADLTDAEKIEADGLQHQDTDEVDEVDDLER